MSHLELYFLSLHCFHFLALNFEKIALLLANQNCEIFFSCILLIQYIINCSILLPRPFCKILSHFLKIISMLKCFKIDMHVSNDKLLLVGMQLPEKYLRSKRRNSSYIFQVVASLPTKDSYYWHYLHWHRQFKMYQMTCVCACAHAPLWH